MTRTASTRPLTERQLLVLRVLADPRSYRPTAHDSHFRAGGLAAWFVADVLVDRGFQQPHISRRGYANGAANTLASLARRGLVSGSDTGGCFVSCIWSITDAGREAIAEATDV